MNFIVSFLLVASILYGAFTGTMATVSDTSMHAAKDAVTLALGLIGVMSFWLGMMKIVERAGGVEFVGKLISPVLKKLFPDVPEGHPAFGAIVMNLATNVLGLGNAATPFGLKAMESLKSLSVRTGEATHAMCMFLAINTSGVAILPLGVIGVRASAGCIDPVGIWIPTLIATTASTISGITVCLLCRKFSGISDVGEVKFESTEKMVSVLEKLPPLTLALRNLFVFISLIAYCVAVSIAFKTSPSLLIFLIDTFFKYWLVPSLIFFIILFGTYKNVSVYETAVEGAKEGFQLAVTIIPFLVIVLVAIGVSKASGLFGLLSGFVEPVSSLFGIPAEAVPMAIIRPLSGTGAFALMSEVVVSNPNSYASFVASVMMGSTETTFYVLSVYFGSVGITKFRYAVLAGIVADVAGMVTSGVVSSWWWVA